MKGYELIKEMPNMKLGTKIRRIKDGQIYKLEKVECKKERRFSRVGNKKGIERFMTYENMHRDFEVIEEKEGIKELHEHKVLEYGSLDIEENRLKINELVRQVNKLTKEMEAK